MTSMPQSSLDGQTNPHTEQIILGVDTHKDIHVAALITTLGVKLADATFATTAAGYRQLLAWARGSACCAVPGWRAPAPTARP
jgi:hypothetical protein